MRAVFVALAGVVLLSVFFMATIYASPGSGGGQDLEVTINLHRYIKPSDPDAKTVIMVLTAKNHTDEPVTFSGNIWHGGVLWGRHDDPYILTPNSSVYWIECGTPLSHGGCTHFWKGYIGPRSEASFILPTYITQDEGDEVFVYSAITFNYIYTPKTFTVSTVRSLTGVGEPFILP